MFKKIFLFICVIFLLAAEQDPLVKSIELANEEKFEEAIKILQEILSKNPSDFNTLLTYGLVLIQTKKYDQAKTVLEKAVKINEKSIQALYALAMLYEKLQQKENAIKTWEKLLSLVKDKDLTDLCKKHIQILKEK